MAVISFWKHERYPGLNIEISIDPAMTALEQKTTVALFAQGDTDALDVVEADMLAWHQRHKLKLDGRRNTDFLHYKLEIKAWSILADFVLVWVGIDNLSSMLQERQTVERHLVGEVKMLSSTIDHLTTKIDHLTLTVRRL